MKINKVFLITTIISLSLATTIFSTPINAFENIPNVKLARAEKLYRRSKSTSDLTNANPNLIQENVKQINYKYEERLARLAVGRKKSHEKLITKLDLEITNLTQKGFDTSNAKSLFKEYKINYDKLMASTKEEKFNLRTQVSKNLKDLRKVLKQLEK